MHIIICISKTKILMEMHITTDTSAGQTHLFIQKKKKIRKFPECQINIRTVY